jgi:hypothetical protein
MKIYFLIAASLALSGTIWAQGTAQIQGTVTDASGAAIPGAEVKATQTDTSAVRTISTGADGVYTLPSLPLGPYKLEVSKTGFSTYTQTGIVLQVNTSPTVDVALKVGTASESIQVEANAALVDTERTSVGSVIENQRILELPLNGRNPVELIALAGASVPAGGVGTASMPGGLNISVGGGLPSGVGYYLDGAMYNNPFDSVNLPFPFPDALQEFKVETSSVSAETGMHAAGAVSAVVKSGTNQIHGDVFEFLRNGDFNARNAFAATRDSLKRNQYGGTLGGPIIKNKLFLFGGYQGTKTRSDPADRTGFVPTAQMLQGDFSGCGTFPANIIDFTTGAPFAGKQIPTSRFSPQALKIVGLLPKATGPCGNTTFGPVQKINENQGLARGDYQISSRQTIFARYMATTYFLPPAYEFSKNLLDTGTGGLDDIAHAATLGDTFLFTPTTVNAFRISMNRVSVFRFNDDYFSGCDLGVNMNCYVPHQTVVTVTGGPAIGTGTAIDAHFIPTYFALSDDVHLVRGSHQIAIGYSSFKYQHSQKANVFSAASFSFGGLAASLNGGTGLGMADFLLGRLNNITQGTPNTTFANKWYQSLYVQDTWKMNRRLTLNYGLRWEPFLPEGINNGAIFNFSIANLQKGVRSTVFKNAPAGLLYAGDPGFEGKTGVNRRYNQFGPRLGIAFDPNADGKTVIRASFGTAYDYPNIQIMSTPTTAPPFGNTITPPGPLSFADPYASVAGGNPFPGTFGADAPFVRFGSFMAQQPDAKGTTVYSWNLALQRQIGTSTLLSATYLGSHTIHIWGSKQLNPAIIIPGTLGTCPAGVVTGCNATSNTNQRRLASIINPTEGQYLGPVDSFDDGGTGSYNALLLSVEHRLSHGFSMNANYTWSHCIADVNAGSYVGSVGNGQNIADNRRFDRGNCQTLTGTNATVATDRHHVLNITGVLAAPKFSNPALRMVAYGWKVAASYRAFSGAFQNVTTGVDYALNGSSVERPNQILPNPLCANPNPSCWINPAAFSTSVPFGTFGNLGRTNVPGPSFAETDMNLSREFAVRERLRMEVRAEAFNLTNSFRAGNPTAARNSPQFGQILTALDPRILQLAAKFSF